ncbi:MAG: TRAP transporter large permease [Deltaproteobacteria bacterium]|nr:TRAP transporter large permease [Deltaproteobacteria bacterium]
MSPILIAVLMLVLTIVLILLGVHIGITLLSTSVLGLWFIVGDFSISASLMGTGPFSATFDYALAVIPLFVVMGLFTHASGASEDLYRAGFAWFGRLPGGLGIVTVMANAVFAAVTGVSIASAAVFSRIAVPQMLRYGYGLRFSTGCVAGSSALGMLIPPSIMLLLYGVLANQSVGALFIAGIVPGLVLACVFSGGIVLMSYLSPGLLGNPVRPEKLRKKEMYRATIQASSIVALAVLILGGMYAGLFTPTEAGAIGTVGAVFIMIVKRRFRLQEMKTSLMDAGFTTASVFLLFIGAQMFGRMLAVSGLVATLGQWVSALQVHPKLIIVGMLLVFVLLGCFLDVLSILVICIPIMLPVLDVLKVDLIWFGVLATLAIESGLVTPPFGMSVFVVKGALGDMVKVEDIILGSMPFLLMLFLTIAILLFTPSLATWLPSLM